MEKPEKTLITTKEIFEREIENVKANRFLNESEKQAKIKELLSHIPAEYKKEEKKQVQD